MEEIDNIHYIRNQRRDNILKGFTNIEESLDEILEKGGKAAAIGEIRTFAGKQYEKKSYGWKLLAKSHPHHASQQPDPQAAHKQKMKDLDDKLNKLAPPRPATPAAPATPAPAKAAHKPIAVPANAAAVASSDQDVTDPKKKIVTNPPAAAAPAKAGTAKDDTEPSYSHQKKKNRFYIGTRVQGGMDDNLYDDDKGYHYFDNQADAEEYAKKMRKHGGMSRHYWVEDHKGNQPD